jgi:hypothetical protein
MSIIHFLHASYYIRDRIESQYAGIIKLYPRLLTRGPGFIFRQVYVEFIVGKVALGLGFLPVSPCGYHSTNSLHSISVTYAIYIYFYSTYTFFPLVLRPNVGP